MSRLTRNQQVVLKFLEQQPQPLSAQDIFTHLRGEGHRIGLATVYRALETLQGEGHLQTINLGDHQSHYQVVPQNGHSRHHLICISCHKVIPLSTCPVEILEDKLSKDYNFAIDYHVLDFYGTCETCRA